MPPFQHRRVYEVYTGRSSSGGGECVDKGFVMSNSIVLAWTKENGLLSTYLFFGANIEFFQMLQRLNSPHA